MYIAFTPVRHTSNCIGQLLSAVGDILSTMLTQCSKGYFQCACGVFAHIRLYGCDYRASPSFGDTRDHSVPWTGQLLGFLLDGNPTVKDRLLLKTSTMSAVSGVRITTTI